MKMISIFKKKRYEPDEAIDQTFVAFIFKGNRQVIRRTVTASKRFRIDDETYIIKPECIFLKNIEGILRPVSYYREGNPNPYDFKKENKGITAVELDRLYAEDFYHIITELRPETRMKYVLMLVACTFAISIAFLIAVMVKIYV